MKTKTPKIEQLHVADIRPRKDNRDEINQKDPGFLELKASIEQDGLLQPILVSPMPDKGKYEIVAGERRYQAVKALGHTHINAIVDAVDLATLGRRRLAENRLRENLTLWEEARQVEQIAKSLPKDVTLEVLATKAGLTPQRVAQCRVIFKMEGALRTEAEKRTWPFSLVAEIVRLPATAQAEVLQRIKANWQYRDSEGPPHSKMVKEIIKDQLNALDAAPWKKDDATLVPAAGACLSCPKRSSQAAVLFPDIKETKNGGGDRCLDRKCYEGKRDAFVALNLKKIIDKAAEEKKPIVMIGSQYDDDAKKFKGVTGPLKSEWDFDKVKEGTKGAIQALQVTDTHGRQAGTVFYVKPRASSNGKKERDPTTGQLKPPTTKERLKKLNDKRTSVAGEMWKEQLPKLPVPKLDVVVRLVAVFGTKEKHDLRYSGSDWTSHAKLDDVAARLWKQLFPVFVTRVTNHGTLDNGPEVWAEAKKQAEALSQLDVWQGHWQAAVAEVKLPKALADQGVADPDVKVAKKPKTLVK